MRIKICGITQREQGQAIAELGATALGFICVPSSPRYLPPNQIKPIIANLPANLDFVGVFAHSSPEKIIEIAQETGLTGIQLHGDESPAFCQEIRRDLPDIELIKAFRIKTPETLTRLPAYYPYINTILLDAYHPQQLGGTGLTIDQSVLLGLNLPLPWFLAGGLTPDNILTLLSQIHPDGIDLSSGVERSPGDKDLGKVKQLFRQLKHYKSGKTSLTAG